MKQYTVTWAVPQDIDGIMKIENTAFAESIRENAETFRERLAVFPYGNTILRETAGPNAHQSQKAAGYFCAELWDAIPPAKPEFFMLNHSIKTRHIPQGTILYISSLALMPRIKGRGRFLFNESIKLIRADNPQIVSIILLVNELWLPARHIYETEGFRYTETLSSFFTNEENDETPIQSDGLLMRKDLIGIENS